MRIKNRVYKVINSFENNEEGLQECKTYLEDNEHCKILTEDKEGVYVINKIDNGTPVKSGWNR
jgi:hypothetical protein